MQLSDALRVRFGRLAGERGDLEQFGADQGRARNEQELVPARASVGCGEPSDAAQPVGHVPLAPLCDPPTAATRARAAPDRVMRVQRRGRLADALAPHHARLVISARAGSGASGPARGAATLPGCPPNSIGSFSNAGRGGRPRT
jgi:hypothetical protein